MICFKKLWKYSDALKRSCSSSSKRVLKEALPSCPSHLAGNQIKSHLASKGDQMCIIRDALLLWYDEVRDKLAQLEINLSKWRTLFVFLKWSPRANVDTRDLRSSQNLEFFKRKHFKAFSTILHICTHSENCHEDPNLSNIYPSFIQPTLPRLHISAP